MYLCTFNLLTNFNVNMKNFSIFLTAVLFAAMCFSSCEQDVEVVSIELNETTLTLAIDSSFVLTATVKPDNATDKTVTWTSGNPLVARVENGIVTAVAEGTAIITATAGGKTETCEVTVEPNVVIVEVESITLVPDRITLNTVGEKRQLNAIILPSGLNPAITWSSSNNFVASVNNNGMVTAEYSGTAIITATAGGKSATCEVTVNVQTYYETLKFHKILYTGYRAADVLDTYSYTDDDGILYEDTLAIISVVFLATGVDYSNSIGLYGSGVIAWMEVAALYEDVKTGINAGASSIYILGRYAASNALPTTVNDWIVNHQDPKKFLKGNFNVAGMNAALNMWFEGAPTVSWEDYLTGSYLLFLNSPMSTDQDLEYYGIISETEFELGVSGGALVFNSYNLTGQIILWAYSILDEEEFYADASGQYVLPKQAGDTDLIKLVRLDNPWLKTSSGAPAKVVRNASINAAKFTRIAPKANVAKFKKIDWSKAKVLDLKSNIKTGK